MLRPHFLFFPLFILLLIGLCQAVHARPKSMADLEKIGNNLVNTQIKHGAIPALFKPEYINAQDAALSMEREDIVFIVMLPNGVHIYPQRVMAWHQVVNELINDYAYIVTYCPITGTLAAYDASMKGINLMFDTEGRLYDGNSVLIDRNTGSLWLQELGMAFQGPLAGRGLPMLKVFWTDWGHAIKVYPDAKVLLPPNSRKAYGRDPYGNYAKEGTYYDNDVTIYRLQRIDRRLQKKTPMLCLEIQGNLLAIDINYVKRKGAVNFFLGSLALVALHDERLNVIRVFDRKIWAEPFLFVRKNGKITDIHTNSMWDPASGRAYAGPLQGSSMKQFYGYYSMWMAWASMNPETSVIPGDNEVPESMLSTRRVDETLGNPIPKKETPKAPRKDSFLINQ